MSLALVQIPATDFQQLHQHLTTYRPGQHNMRNMHLREMRQQNKRSVLRYLHAMYATSATEIEGMISGPSAFWHYKLRLVGGQTQVRVITRRSSAQEDARLGRQFLPEILRRMRAEQTRGQRRFPKLTPGQFYLRRSLPGMPAAHQHCQNAVAAGVLDPLFVAQIHGWNLKLLNP